MMNREETLEFFARAERLIDSLNRVDFPEDYVNENQINEIVVDDGGGDMVDDDEIPSIPFDEKLHSKIKKESKKHKKFEGNVEIIRKYKSTPEERKSGILRRCRFFFLNNPQLTRQRIKILSKKVKDLGGTVSLLENSTHFISNSCYSDLIKLLSKNNNMAINEAEEMVKKKKLLKGQWISECLVHGRLVRYENFEVKKTKVYTKKKEDVMDLTNDDDDFDYDSFEMEIRNLNVNWKDSDNTECVNREDTFCLDEPRKEWGSNVNHDFVEELRKMQEVYRSLHEEHRRFAYGKAMQALTNHPKRVRSGREAMELRNIGKSIGSQIHQLIKDGKIYRLEHLEGDKQIQFIRDLTAIHGIGVKTAERFWQLGYRDISVVKNEARWNSIQSIGLRYDKYKNEKIPRSEVKRIGRFFREESLKIRSSVKVVICGSYRRGKEFCGDVDLILMDNSVARDEKPYGLLNQIVKHLGKIGFILDTLMTSYKEGRKEGDIFLGYCKLLDDPNAIPRRIDVKVYSRECYPFGLLYFTGSERYVRSMRFKAKRYKGTEYSLSEKALTVVYRGMDGKKKHKLEKVKNLNCERDIVEFLGLPWKDPEQRNDTDAW